jgi:hypothetical protein
MTGDRSFEDLVTAVTPRVVEEALERAVDQAKEELSERFARAIVERAVLSAQRSASADPTPGEPRPPAGSNPGTDAAAAPAEGAFSSSGEVRPAQERTGTALYAFAIMPARPVDLTGLCGIDGASPLRIIQHADLGLVVSEMPLDLMDDVSEDDLSETSALATLARRHDDVVRSVFEHGPVLPLRFGTVVVDDEGARRLLEEQAPSARRRLAHLDTHREWGVRLNRDAVTGEAEQRRDDVQASGRRGMTGTAYLASRREALAQAQREEQQTAALTAQVEDALREHAVDVVRRGGGPGSGVLTDVAYLVPVEVEDAFLDAARRLSSDVAHEDLSLEVTGPWPPYSFASLQPAGSAARTHEGVVGSA